MAFSIVRTAAEKIAVNLCRLARLRVAAQLYAVAGFTLASPISAPVCANGLPGRKKGNQNTHLRNFYAR